MDQYWYDKGYDYGIRNDEEGLKSCVVESDYVFPFMFGYNAGVAKSQNESSIL
jgi:hypothetical protein